MVKYWLYTKIIILYYSVNGRDGMNYFDRQKEDARSNYNYFFIKLFFSILKIIFKLSIILIISGFLNFTFINIIAISFTIYSFYEIYRLCTYYIVIINDIKNTLEIDLFFEIDFNIISRNILGSVLKYGK